MFRTAPRALARQSALRALPRTGNAALPAGRRALSTAPPAQKSRSWKNLFARLGAAGAVIYYYNTTDVFGDEPRLTAHVLPTTDSENEQLPTIESIAAERQKRRAVQAQLDAQRAAEEEAARAAAAVTSDPETEAAADGSIEGLEAEADQQGAFNPETGEINWDCPCLGGMAHGPCGEEFRDAFSCFVYSKEEPKGMDCIDKFKNMQNCFRQYPEIYGSEIDKDDAADDDVDDDDFPTAPAASSTSTSTSTASSDPAPVNASSASPQQASSTPHSAEKVAENRRELGLVPENYRPEESKADSTKHEDSLVPKAAHDGRE